ncbi:MAG TPA: Ig-like domain-containing protein [Acidimicrobiia bacterium]|nr:Ig-like domain-containing protein [Acidimicrobiia bacterium]
MRRHTWSGAAVIAALALAAISCGGDTSASAPVDTGHQPITTSGQIALSRKADTVTVDQSLQLTAIVPTVPGSVVPTIAWASSDTSVAFVTKHGVLFALKSGRTTITATRSGYTDAATVLVNPGIREISFESDSLAISLGHSIRIPYRVRDTDGNTVDLSKHRVEWVSSSPDVAPLTGDATVTGRTIGRSSLLLRVDNKVGTTGVRVLSKPVASVFVSPSSVSIAAGQTAQLTGTAYDVNGNPIEGRNVSWSSSNANVASIDNNGLLTAVAVGEAEITANASGRKTAVPVTVTARSSNPSGAAVASVTVSLNSPSLVAGQSTQANATLKDAGGAVLTGRSIVWTSSDAHVANVNGSGLVTAVQAGTVTITATAEGKSGNAPLGVTAGSGTSAPVASVTLSVASSINVGQTAQASVTLKDASGNVLTGRPIYYVSSDAAIASVSSSGLVSALKGGSVTITASSEDKTANAVVTSVAPKPAVKSITLMANASTLNVGELTQVTAIPKDVNGSPISGLTVTWSSSPSAVATVSSSGMAAARSAGTAQIYAQVDAVSSNIGITVLDTMPTPISTSYPGGNGTLNAMATMAELPRASVSTAYPAPARQVRVAAGANLQAALDAAQPGDELLLAPGATFVGNFTLRNKGATSSWITIRTDVSDAAIGAPGTRMTPSRAASANLAKILTPNDVSAIATDLSANHYRITGVELGGTSGAQEINGIVRFGDGSSVQNSVSLVAHNLVLDRAYVHGLPTQAVRRCVNLQSATSAVVDSWLSECHSNNGDSQGIVGWNGPGPYLIKNNHIEGGHQAVFFGGADPFITNLSPSDITVIGNHITRPASWVNVWQTKTIIETKNARRMLLEGNVIENVWASAQAGYALLLKSENQSGTAPWSQSTDLTVRYNRIQNVGSGINIAAAPGWAPAVPAARISIYDNVITNLGSNPWAGEGIPLQILGGTYDVVVAHNSWSNAGNQAISFDGGASTRTVIHSNVIPNGAYGVKGSGTGSGYTTINNYMPGGLFSYDVIVGADCSVYPATTTCPSSAPSSPGIGYDARTIGPDMSKINSATSGAIVAP